MAITKVLNLMSQLKKTMKKVEKEIKWQQKLIRGKLSYTFLIFSTC
jgi:hypothetical protein